MEIVVVEVEAIKKEGVEEKIKTEKEDKKDKREKRNNNRIRKRRVEGDDCWVFIFVYVVFKCCVFVKYYFSEIYVKYKFVKLFQKI